MLMKQKMSNSSEAQGYVRFDNEEFEDQLGICKNMMRDKLKKGKLCKIHPNVNVYHNSLNVLCGPQGSGKSYSALKECAKISQIDKNTHLLVIVCKNENKNDPTISIFEPLINVDIEIISESEAEDYMKTLFEYKRLYNVIIEQNLADKIEDQQRNDLFNILHITDFSKQWLHTLLLVNDSAKCQLFKTGAYFSQMVALGRHTQTSTFLCIQYWKGLSPEVKANISSAFIFGVFSRQQLVHILSQLPSQYDYKEIYNIYRTLTKRDKMIFTNGKVSVERITY